MRHHGNQRKGGFIRKRDISHVSTAKKLKETADQGRNPPTVKAFLFFLVCTGQTWRGGVVRIARMGAESG